MYIYKKYNTTVVFEGEDPSLPFATRFKSRKSGQKCLKFVRKVKKQVSSNKTSLKVWRNVKNVFLIST